MTVQPYGPCCEKCGNPVREDLQERGSSGGPTTYRCGNVEYCDVREDYRDALKQANGRVEITDAMVERAMTSWFGDHSQEPESLFRFDMRDALEAALNDGKE